MNATLETIKKDQNQDLLAPGQLRVIKRNGQVVSFNQEKISLAINKAFFAVEGDAAKRSSSISSTVNKLATTIMQTFQRRLPSGGTLHIEEIQDQVELALMRHGEHKIARAYVLYREQRSQQRDELRKAASGNSLPQFNVMTADQGLQPLDVARLTTVIAEACQDLAEVDPVYLLQATLRTLYEGVHERDVAQSLVMTARTMVEQEPNYSYVTARLLLDNLRTETLGYFKLTKAATQKEMSHYYPQVFANYIHRAIELKRLSPDLADFHLEALGHAIKPERDLQFTYLGLQTLYDRYFIHEQDTRLELPQVFFMRVAMGLALEEDDKNKRAIEFYELLSSFDYMSSTPTLFNAGTLRSQLSSCYLTTIPDDLLGIYGAIKDNAMLSKWAGGLGNDWTPVRALGAHIQGTNGQSQGVVPFLKVVNDTAVAVNQGGKRKGAVCAYLETWHLDIEEFLELRKNTGDDRRRTHDMNTANWIPDLFMKRVFDDQQWTLFSPNVTPDLHDLYGKAFEERYTSYEKDADEGRIKLYKRVNARDIWRKMLSMLFETGHPWLTFKDPCNLRSPQQHTGVVHSSNLCTEITLNTSEDEIAVCNLGSVNLAQHLKVNDAGMLELDEAKLEKTINTAIRMLDNVIDINYYAVPQAKRSNLQHRPIGMGLMGFQDCLYQLGLPYGSNQAVEFADHSMEAISYYAIKASTNLAQERGQYPSYQGSLWSQGILPIDSIAKVREERGADYVDMDESSTKDWDSLRQQVLKHGMRNSNVMAIAPTATISNIVGVTQSIEPTYQNLYVKSNLSGEFTVVNPYLVKELKRHELWDKAMVNDLKFFDGSVEQIDRVPDEVKTLFANAFEVEPRWLVDAASRRQKWIDQAQSLNLYIREPNGKKLDVTYRMAWYRGLKTTYYLRAMGATSAEKSTINTGQLNAVQQMPNVCSIDNPDCEACQ